MLLQRALVVLLAVNCVIYVLEGAAREAADSMAWFTLLALFYLETSAQPRTRHALVAAGIRYLRLGAAAVVAAAALAYLHAGAWLDAANSALWIAVVALLEAQVRYPDYSLRHRACFTVIAATLYGALALLPVAWLAQREWLAAYDAALWLAAFAIVEMELWSDTASRVAISRTPRETPR
ncbi:MAG TPA: hypothetical protein VNT02_16555 [Burkholderiales bacterium]|nr:hypothetical protein [Burkholderiales bacterium]